MPEPIGYLTPHALSLLQAGRTGMADGVCLFGASVRPTAANVPVYLVAQALAAQAGQEPAEYQMRNRLLGGAWMNCTKSAFDYHRSRPENNVETRALYTRPAPSPAPTETEAWNKVRAEARKLAGGPWHLQDLLAAVEEFGQACRAAPSPAAAAPDPLELVRQYADFCRLLPAGASLPSLSLDPDGALSLDWSRGDDLVSVSIGGDGRFDYAANVAGQCFYGYAFADDGLPGPLCEAIRAVATAAPAEPAATLPCPFCGAADPVFGGRLAGQRWLNCDSCGANGPDANALGDHAAVAAWNRRAAQHPPGLGPSDEEIDRLINTLGDNLSEQDRPITRDIVRHWLGSGDAADGREAPAQSELQRAAARLETARGALWAAADLLDQSQQPALAAGLRAMRRSADKMSDRLDAALAQPASQTEGGEQP